MTNQLELLPVPIEALHQQEFKKGRQITFGIMTRLLDTIVTAQGRSNGMFFNNEKIMIDDIIVDGEYSTIAGTLYEQEKN
jgi:hypothetical protein